MKYFSKLQNGNVKTTLNEDCWDIENEVTMIEGRRYGVSYDETAILDIDEWIEKYDVVVDDIVMCKGDGYRGVTFYNGYYLDKSTNTYWDLDVMGDYVAMKLMELGDE